MNPSETSAAVGYNQYFSVEDLPLTELEKQAVVELLARHLWVVIEESSLYPDYHHKSYDPLVIEGDVAHSYVFCLSEHGSRHHDFENLKDLERRLIEDAIRQIKG